MLHYSLPDRTSSDLTGICKYCGKPLKDPTSIIRGFGDVCFEKHKRKRVRNILAERSVNNGAAENDRTGSVTTWDNYRDKQ